MRAFSMRCGAITRSVSQIIAGRHARAHTRKGKQSAKWVRPPNVSPARAPAIHIRVARTPSPWSTFPCTRYCCVAVVLCAASLGLARDDQHTAAATTDSIACRCLPVVVAPVVVCATARTIKTTSFSLLRWFCERGSNALIGSRAGCIFANYLGKKTHTGTGRCGVSAHTHTHTERAQRVIHVHTFHANTMIVQNISQCARARRDKTGP